MAMLCSYQTPETSLPKLDDQHMFSTLSLHSHDFSPLHRILTTLGRSWHLPVQRASYPVLILLSHPYIVQSFYSVRALAHLIRELKEPHASHVVRE